eukprot:2507569-Prymnesium_polylepis.1
MRAAMAWRAVPPLMDGAIWHRRKPWQRSQPRWSTAKGVRRHGVRRLRWELGEGGLTVGATIDDGP